MAEYEARFTRVTIAPVGDPIFSETATHISIEDDAGGEFVSVVQDAADGKQTIRIAADEWPIIRVAIDSVIARCRPASGK
jgi:hypothetical protein